ncbi:uncharacterized protein LOC128217903 isoform X1 [Mya arenaria]|uniref:uncharacterized protein LOC128217903 isoform X1 n=1 Tax=Mya arenaria TaxID=6604 RepID=UPI0022E36EC1|nr:uncharacterized protein LOC128217903 isoform X1 [Mya arenaria]
MVHLNQTCIDSCPDSHSVVSNGQCFQECNEHSIHLGCKCPEDRPFIEIRTCLTNCSDLISSSSQRFCDESCFPGMLSEKNSQGNYKYINRSMCVESCSDEQAFLCRSLYLNCLPDLIDRELTFCVQTCPLFSFVSGSKCIEYCSDRQYVRNNSCVDNCSSLEYIQRKKYSKFYREGFECVNECSPEFVLFNKTCVDKCPAESPLSLNRTCVKVCPPDQNVKLVVTPRVTCNISEPDCGWIPKAEYFEYLVCKDSCPENEFLLNETCQASCPYTFKSWNGSCLRTCPASVPFLQPEGLFIQYRSWVQSNRWDGYYPLKVGFSFKTTALIVDTCVDTCSEPFEFHDAQLLQCLSGCLNERPFVLETNNALFCVQQCPPYLSLRAHVSKEVSSKTYARTRNIIACRSHCPDETFYFNGSCLPSCPSEAIHVREGKCVGCDKFTLHGDQYAYCVDDCPTSFINGKTCVDEFPKEKGFVINKHCSKCPEEAPFQLDVIFGEDKCVKSCKEDDKLADFSCENCEDTVNAKCIYSFECNEPDMINYDGMCLKYCPDGYVFLWIGCIWNIIPLIIVVLAGVLSISIGIFSRIVIMEYFVFVHYCFSIPKEIKYVLNQNVDILLDQQQGLDNEGFETRLIKYVLNQNVDILLDQQQGLDNEGFETRL